MRVDDFGISLVFDQATGTVLTFSKVNSIAHFVSSCILDTATFVFVNTEKKVIDFPTSIAAGKLIVVGAGLKKSEVELTEAVKEKLRRAEILRRGYALLLSQAYILESSFDGFDFLSTDDLPMYLQRKEVFVETYQKVHSVSHEIAEKHLDFLADNLLRLVARRKQLIAEHSSTLRTVVTQEDYFLWSRGVLNEFVTLGTV